MKARHFFLLILSFLNLARLSAQSPAVQNFRNAYYSGDEARARIAFVQMFRQDSVQAFRFAEEAEDIFIDTEAETTTEWIEIVQRVFAGAALEDKERGFEWRVKRVNLLLRYPEYYEDILTDVLRECFYASPTEIPLHQLETFADRILLGYRGKRISLENFAEDWASIDKALTERSVIKPAESRETLSLQWNLYSDVRKVIPDCAEIHKKNVTWFKQPTTGMRTVKTVFSLLCLQDCAGKFVLDTVWPRLEKISQDPYWSRLAAGMAMNSGEYELCYQLIKKASAAENNPRLKALDLVTEAHLLGLEKKYRKAFDLLQQAMELNPDWGQPYIDMADLMVQAISECVYSEFDRRAVFWAAIDYCSLAKNVDPSWEEDANRRIYEYAQKSPSPGEIAQRGLKAGDTYPLHCWMEVVTTVKVF